MCEVRLNVPRVHELLNLHIPNLMSIPKLAGNLNCATHFDLSFCYSLFPGHLEQIAIACPNLQRLNLRDCNCCLESVKGLKAIASHCRNLTGLNLLPHI